VLSQAVRQGSYEVAAVLLYFNADPDTPSGGYLPIIDAALQNNVAMIELLLDNCAINPSTQQSKCGIDQFGRTPLMRAAVEGDLEELKDLIEEGAMLEDVGEQEWTALIWAAYGNQTPAVELLLSANASVEHTDSMGRNVLCTAIYVNNTEMVAALLTAGADPNVKDGIFGLNAYDLAEHMDADPKILEMLRLVISQQQFRDVPEAKTTIETEAKDATTTTATTKLERTSEEKRELDIGAIATAAQNGDVAGILAGVGLRGMGNRYRNKAARGQFFNTGPNQVFYEACKHANRVIQRDGYTIIDPDCIREMEETANVATSPNLPVADPKADRGQFFYKGPNNVDFSGEPPSIPSEGKEEINAPELPEHESLAHNVEVIGWVCLCIFVMFVVVVGLVKLVNQTCKFKLGRSSREDSLLDVPYLNMVDHAV